MLARFIATVCTTRRRLAQIVPVGRAPTAASADERLAERGQEALVLGPRAVGDADVARVAKALSTAHHDAALAERRGSPRASSRVAERDPGEVRLRAWRLEAELAHSLLDEHPLDDRSLDPLGDVVGVHDRPRPRPPGPAR